MLLKNFFSILACLVLIDVSEKSVNATPDKLVCYVGTWAAYRPGDGKFPIDEIPPDLCTHLVYSFVTANSNSEISSLDEWLDVSLGNMGDSGMIEERLVKELNVTSFKKIGKEVRKRSHIPKGAVQKFTNLKKSNPKLKTLVAMGGWNAGSTFYSSLFSDATRRRTFAKNAVKYLKRYGFDGLDLDWEYPAQRGGAAADVKNFVELCKALRSEFDAHGYLLTAAVGATENIIRLSYDVANIAKYVDFINLMTYDFHTEGPTGHNAPLYPARAEANTADAGLNVKASVEAWIKYGAPASKLVLGMGLYGHSYTLQRQSCFSTRCPSSGAGNAGPITQQPGYLGYNEICQTLKNDKNIKVLWDDEAKVPYYVTGNQWVSYDDKRSFEEKLDFLEKYNLGGGMVWSMETDDFRGNCGGGKYPLLTVLNKRLLGSTISEPEVPQEPETPAKPEEPETPTEPEPEPEKPEEPETPAEPEKPEEPETPAEPEKPQETETPTEICTKVGFVRNPLDCAKFYQCYEANGKFIAAEFKCSSGLVFDFATEACNYKTLVTC